MTNQLLPTPDLAPRCAARLSVEDRIRLWMQVVDAGEQFLLAGLRDRIGPDGDLRAAYRDWYARRMDDHDRQMAHMLTELRRRENRSAG